MDEERADAGWTLALAIDFLRCLASLPTPQHIVGPKPWCTVKHMVRDVKRWVCSSCQATTAKEKEIKPNTQGGKNFIPPLFSLFVVSATQYRRRVPRETLFSTSCGRAYLFQCPFIQLSEVSMPNNPLFRSCRSISTILEMSADVRTLFTRTRLGGHETCNTIDEDHEKPFS